MHHIDMTLLLEETFLKLKMSFDFANHTVTWDNASVLMRNLHSLETLIKNSNSSNSFYWKEELGETDALQSATDRIKRS